MKSGVLSFVCVTVIVFTHWPCCVSSDQKFYVNGMKYDLTCRCDLHKWFIVEISLTLNFSLLYETILVITVWHAEPDWSFTDMEYITIIKLYCSYLNTDLDCHEVAWVFESESLLTCRSCQCVWGYVSSTYVCAPISVMHKVVFMQYLWKPLSLPLHFGFIFSLSPRRIYALKVLSWFGLMFFSLLHVDQLLLLHALYYSINIIL